MESPQGIQEPLRVGVKDPVGRDVPGGLGKSPILDQSPDLAHEVVVLHAGDLGLEREGAALLALLSSRGLPRKWCPVLPEPQQVPLGEPLDPPQSPPKVLGLTALPPPGRHAKRALREGPEGLKALP